MPVETIPDNLVFIRQSLLRPRTAQVEHGVMGIGGLKRLVQVSPDNCVAGFRCTADGVVPAREKRCSTCAGQVHGERLLSGGIDQVFLTGVGQANARG